MKRPRRNHTAAYKAKVALAALKGDKTLAELSEKFDVHASQVVQWKTQLLDGAMGVFLTPAEKREAQVLTGIEIRVFLGVGIFQAPNMLASRRRAFSSCKRSSIFQGHSVQMARRKNDEECRRRAERACKPRFFATDLQRILTPANTQGPSVKDMQAKIGQLALENDFLAGALGRIDGASAKK
jgi:hypothetical protein